MYSISIFDVDAKMQFLGSVGFSGKPWEAIKSADVKRVIGDVPRKVMLIFSNSGLICGYGSYEVHPGDLQIDNVLVDSDGTSRDLGDLHWVDVYIKRGEIPLKVNWGPNEWDDWLLNFHKEGDTLILGGGGYKVEVRNLRYPTEYILIDTSF